LKEVEGGKMKEELVKRYIIVLEIKNHKEDATLNDRSYYELFYEDVIRYIYFLAHLNLSHYDENTVRKVVILNKIDITDHIFSNRINVNDKLLETSTIPHVFEIVNAHILFDAIKKVTDSAIFGDIKVSVYFDFLIVNELTMFFKYEIYRC
jgi:hypothetical protein